ncbi:hypothetical protein LCGC14_2394300 [marine sediment metagenome]|uniref:Uncharacterized protein n=1 Tax=marine sediment metagenome TaxID=412755 RepID=A0A0F9CJB3_9ZZZZ
MTIKRKIDDKDYIHQLLKLKTKVQLKQICRDYKIKGFSKYNVVELIDFVHNSLTEEQLEKIFEIPENLKYSKEFNSDSDRELDKIYEIIKDIYPEYRAVNIEKQDFKQIDVKGHIQGKRLDFTISFGVKMMQPSTVTYKDGTTFSIDYRFTLRKLDFISIQKVSQEGNTFHQIYHIEFGNLPDWSMLPSLNDWLLMAGLDYEDGNFCEAINLYSMLLSEFDLSDDIRVDLLVHLGLSYVGIEKYNWAIDSYMEAKDINPNSSIIWINLGIAYKEKGDKKKAKKAFKKAYEVNPEKKDINENNI